MARLRNAVGNIGVSKTSATPTPVYMGNLVIIRGNTCLVYQGNVWRDSAGADLKLIGTFTDFYSQEYRSAPLIFGDSEISFIVGSKTKMDGIGYALDQSAVFSVTIGKSNFNPTWQGEKCLIVTKVR